jgi:hypothetical protein
MVDTADKCHDLCSRDVAVALEVVLGMLTNLTFSEILYVDALVAAVTIGAGEWFFHKYVVARIFPDRKES